ncbi:hypothetical protein GGI42DRAFT_120545 [Trichoderma sp. SZMC 28013]
MAKAGGDLVMITTFFAVFCVADIPLVNEGKTPRYRSDLYWHAGGRNCRIKIGILTHRNRPSGEHTSTHLDAGPMEPYKPQTTGSVAAR